MITQPHCQLCGNTDPEDVNDPELEGYSGCCNEPVVFGNCGDAAGCSH